jgi:hypothetical protein
MRVRAVSVLVAVMVAGAVVGVAGASRPEPRALPAPLDSVFQLVEDGSLVTVAVGSSRNLNKVPIVVLFTDNGDCGDGGPAYLSGYARVFFKDNGNANIRIRGGQWAGRCADGTELEAPLPQRTSYHATRDGIRVKPSPEDGAFYIPRVCDGGEGEIVGTNGPGVLVGTEGDDIITALGGDDQVDGLGGTTSSASAPGTTPVSVAWEPT